MMMKVALILIMATLVRCQRPSFAGSRPIGYPEITSTSTEGLGDRFGEVDGTTQRLPIEANGDRDLVDRLSKLPIDKQPFWFINWQAYEAHRQKPQTYPQKPNPFIDPPQNNQVAKGNSANSGNLGSSSGSLGSSDKIGNRFGNSGSTNLNSASVLVPNSNAVTPSVANRISETTSISANQNSGLTASLEDRFSGGIELNRYNENVNSNTEKVKQQYYYL